MNVYVEYSIIIHDSPGIEYNTNLLAKLIVPICRKPKRPNKTILFFT